MTEREPPPPPSPADPEAETQDDARTVSFKLILVIAPFAVVLALGLLEWWLRSRGP